MNQLASVLKSGKFAVTTELNPPKGTNLGPMLRRAAPLKGLVDAFNVTDSASSRMTMAPVAAAHMLLDEGLEPILQITCRDKNRIAIQADLLGASALGITNLLCMRGDNPQAGDHPDATPVFDIETIELLEAIGSLRSGTDMMGAQLRGAPELHVGAVCNPGSPDMEGELKRMEEKIAAGAEFFQTQAVYDSKAFDAFMSEAKAFDIPVLAGMILLKSGDMARNLNANLWGVSVPDGLIRELDDAEDKGAKCIEIAARTINEISSMCHGVHIMAIGWESRIPKILEGAGLSPG
ncbi:MAG: methylenetetrahydrofolate reductase [SAR202 cluster bacterium]|nr:methylenetetrahydrofolate reductase [SAR202 cluster bacterium]MDP6664104.1 methylenetetrahydrofolate reductase [SAR202 cluster bacterium]